MGELCGRNAAVPLPGQKRSGDGDALGEGQAKGRYRRRARVANPLDHQACPDGKHTTLAMKACLSLVLSLMSSIS